MPHLISNSLIYMHVSGLCPLQTRWEAYDSPHNRKGLRAFSARHSLFIVHFASAKIKSWLRQWRS